MQSPVTDAEFLYFFPKQKFPEIFGDFRSDGFPWNRVAAHVRLIPGSQRSVAHA
jgi:hypothetical protein